MGPKPRALTMTTQRDCVPLAKEFTLYLDDDICYPESNYAQALDHTLAYFRMHWTSSLSRILLETVQGRFKPGASITLDSERESLAFMHVELILGECPYFKTKFAEDADIKHYEIEKCSLLQTLCAGDNLPVLEWVIEKSKEKGHCVDWEKELLTANVSGLCSIIQAAYRNSKKVMKYIMDNYPKAVKEAAMSNGVTCAQLAAYNGELELCKMLLELQGETKFLNKILACTFLKAAHWEKGLTFMKEKNMGFDEPLVKGANAYLYCLANQNWEACCAIEKECPSISKWNADRDYNVLHFAATTCNTKILKATYKANPEKILKSCFVGQLPSSFCPDKAITTVLLEIEEKVKNCILTDEFTDEKLDKLPSSSETSL